MSVVGKRVHDLDDPRVQPFQVISQGRSAEFPELFVAEGRWMVERLLASRFEVESVLVAESRLAQWEATLPDGTSLLVMETGLLQDLLGYNFHRGVVALGRRAPWRDLPVETPADTGADPPRLPVWVACPRVINPENLGSIIRSAAAFGALGVICGEGCADPFSRRTIRVSAGNVFRIPIVQPADVLSLINRLRKEEGWQALGTVSSDSNSAEDLASFRPEGPSILLMGSEDFGLEPNEIASTDRRLYIPMHGGTDSLNVAVATAVCLYSLGLAYSR